MNAAVIAPVQRNLEEVPARLGEWLGSKLPDARNLILSDLSYPVGAGLSNETILFEARWSDPQGERSEGFVLRMEPGDYRVYMELDFRAQFDLQRALAKDGQVPVPELLWFEEDASLFGGRFFVMRRLRGQVAVSHPPYTTKGWVFDASPEDRRAIWHNGVEALARVHDVPLDILGMLDKPQHGRTGWEQEWNYWLASHAWSRGDRVLETCDSAIAWLKANMPAERPSGLCWGDARIGNLFYGYDFNVLAVMDWEGASLGGNLHDLGFWVLLQDVMSGGGANRLDGFGSREETIELWEKLTGASAQDIRWYEVFAALKLASHVNRKLTLDGDSREGFNYGDNPASRLLAKMLDLPPPSPVR